MQKDKTLIMTAEDYKRAVEDGLATLDMVNRDICVGGRPFVAIGDPTVSSPSSTKFVIKCVAISSNSILPRRTWQLI